MSHWKKSTDQIQEKEYTNDQYVTTEGRCWTKSPTDIKSITTTLCQKYNLDAMDIVLERYNEDKSKN